MEVVNRNPTFGSALLNDNFGRRPTDDMKSLDPLHLGAQADGAIESERATTNRAPAASGKSNSPLLQNPNGATQMFNPVGEENGHAAADSEAGRAGIRGLTGVLTVGAERAGNTDWQTGTDGGKSAKSRVGIPYGTFAGV
ncbi:hypothetical protein M758_4G119200 [Ceratodon purpureus]|uniref:Uncharacterized protein n=1 Tax=Ceratodon purpureus TaxID=3225 RepID=A0A8T0I7Q2_CERPU|nr:hypothetical protein KC19_4G118600 [Ceratodon purpureus]KAG0619127.1 hypothetical protein M758_4G119200 [Ceratodon purpureus]